MYIKSNGTYIDLVTFDTDRSYKSWYLLTCLMCGQQFLEILFASGGKNESYKKGYAKHVEIHTG